MACSKVIIFFVMAPIVLASPTSSSMRFLSQSDSAEYPCGRMGEVMEEVMRYPTRPLWGTLTGNLPSVANVEAPLNMTGTIPLDYKVYSEGQLSIHSPPEHCTKQFNNYVKSDFEEAWGYLECDLQRLFSNPVVASAFEAAVQGLAQIVEDASNPPVSYPNPWIGATPDDFVKFFKDYFWFLPMPTGNKTGLDYILKEQYFERGSPASIYFLNKLKSRTAPASEYSTEIFDWTYRWVTARGILLDSDFSKTVISDWVGYNNEKDQKANANVDMSAYKYYDPSDEKGFGYKSFNQFFSRQFKRNAVSRPVSQPDAPMVVTAPGDVEINFIYSKLRTETKIPIKGIHTMNVHQLLGGSAHASRFVGGTAVSCVLMPYAYHNFHSPVDGELIEAVDVPGFLFGIPDGTAWFGGGNTGTPTGDFDIFGGFHRSYFIYDTGRYGLVAQIAVGLADVSTICASVGSHVGWVTPGSCCCEAAAKQGHCDAAKPRCDQIKKGEHIGYFAYGGSLNILLFETQVFNSMNVLMGNRIGSMSNATK